MRIFDGGDVTGQSKGLWRLRERGFRRALLDHLVEWSRGDIELIVFGPEDVPDDGVDRPFVDGRDPVPVAAGQVVVPATDADRAARLLDGDFALPPEDARARQRSLCCDLVVLYRTAFSTMGVLDAIRRLRRSGIDACPNHIAMLGGTDKGGVDPSLAEPLPTGATSSDDPLVVVIDTGLDRAAEQRTDGWLDDVNVDDDPHDYDELDVFDPSGNVVSDGLLDLGAGHGTFVAGVVRQVHPNSRVVMLRALNTHGVGTELELAVAICRAAALFDDADGRGVLNISMGMETWDGQEPLALRCALDQLPAEVLVVAAAGNKPTGVPWWPAASKRVLGVASHGGDARGLTPSRWSNYGSWVDFSARGEDVVSTFVSGSETTDKDPTSPFGPHGDVFPDQDPCARWTGTSFAAPQVAGLLARLLESDHTMTRAAAQRKLQQGHVLTSDYGYLLADEI